MAEEKNLEEEVNEPQASDETKENTADEINGASFEKSSKENASEGAESKDESKDASEEASKDVSEGASKESGADAGSSEKSEEERAKEVADAVKSALEKDEKPSKEQQQIEELTDKVKRQMAEFENFRKRSEREKGEMFDAGAVNIIGKILPVVDNFERGLAAAPEGDAFAEGMEKIYRQFTTTLTEIGVTPIDAVGKPFDPNFHNAVMHVDDDQYGESEVVEELQKGYMYHDKVVRHSMVKVAN